jgi:DHA2 family multidrug resistance protein
MQIIVDRGERADWFNSPWIVGAAIVSLAATLLLVFRELRVADPIVELRFLKIRQFAGAVFGVVMLSFILFGTGILNPIFLQEFLGYTAWKAGLVLAPRAFCAMMAMLFAGQIARREIDNKRLIGVAFILQAIGLWSMAHWNLEVGLWQVIWPGMILGFGLGMSFPILSAAALTCVPRERMGYASSLYNMMRNTGAAVGIAYLTSTLVRHQNIHQAYLVQHFSAFDAWRMGNLAPHLPGSPTFHLLDQMVTGQKQGLGMVYGMVQQQSAMLAFADLYRILTLMAIVMIPSFLLFRGANVTGASGPAAH